MLLDYMKKLWKHIYSQDKKKFRIFIRWTTIVYWISSSNASNSKTPKLKTSPFSNLCTRNIITQWSKWYTRNIVKTLMIAAIDAHLHIRSYLDIFIVKKKKKFGPFKNCMHTAPWIKGLHDLYHVKIVWKP